MRIVLDGQIYIIKAGVTRTPIVEWPDNIRFDGQQLRKDRRWLSTWEIGDTSEGLGKQVDHAGGKRLWDVENIDTRFPEQKILSPALVTCTIIPSWGNIRTALDYQNNIYFAQGSNNPTNLFKFAAPQTLGSNTVIGSTNLLSNGLIGVHVMGDTYVCAGADKNCTSHTNLGGGVLIGQLYHDAVYDVKFADLGGTVHVITAINNLHRLYIVPRLLGSLGDFTDINDIMGTTVAPLVSDGVKVYAALSNGIWNFDTIPDKVIDSSRSQDKNPNQVMFQNYLLFKNRYSVMRYDGVDVVAKGYDREDGLPSDKMGEITAFAATWQNVFAAVKGATYSHILSYDGSWQYYARWPSMGTWIKEMFLSNSPDGIDRLWCIPGNAVHPGYFLNPIVNPLQAGTYGYVASGHFTPPIYGGGMADVPGAWLKAVLTSDAVSSGYNDIELHYGLDGKTPTAILTGQAGTTHAELVFGSPNGLAGYRMQPKIILAKVTTESGTTPVLREVLIHFLKDPNKRYTYEFDIDLEKTAKEWQNPIDSVIGSLNYVTNLKTLAPFWYGRIATTYVKVLDQPASEIMKESLNEVFEPERTGFVRVRVAEIL